MKNITFITCNEDIASINMRTKLIEQLGYEDKREYDNFVLYLLNDNLSLVELKKGELIFADSLDKYFKADAFIFLSRHVSKSNIDGIYLHSIGNFINDNSLGGKPNTICYTSSFLCKNIFIALNEEILDNIVIGMEATHHGPYIENIPSIFLEIGSSEEKWRDEKLSETVIKACIRALDNMKEYIPVLAIGGPHYAPAFLKYQAESKYAIGHIIPSYAIENPSFKMSLIKEAINKTIEGVEYVLIDWKGLKSTYRELIIKELDFLKIPYVKIK